MIYQGDTYSFFCNLAKADGSIPVVTTAPLITIFAANSGTPLINSASMILVEGASGLYQYVWDIPASLPLDNYVALYSCVTTEVTIQNQYLGSVRVGDSRVIGVVAMDSTVAKDATVAHADSVATVAALAPLNPDNNQSIQEILRKVSKLPDDPASLTALLNLAEMLGDVRDFALGTWMVDKTVDPQVFTLMRIDGTVLATFSKFEDDTHAYRNRV